MDDIPHLSHSTVLRALEDPCPNAAQAVVLVRPRAFGFNAQTRETNSFQTRLWGPLEGLDVDEPGADSEPVAAGGREGEAARIAALARAEVDGLALALGGVGVRTIVLEDCEDPPKPDALFANNWVSFHAGGTALLYPLLAPVRRRELRPDLLKELRDRHGVDIKRIIDFSPLAGDGSFLEGTGSLVLDRPRRLALACRSPRTTPEGLRAFARATGYGVLAFDALDEGGRPYYHTNVLLSLGDRFALAALEAIPRVEERRRVRAALEAGGRRLITLSRAQVRDFAANVLEISSARGGTVLALSQRAHAALGEEICAALERWTHLVPVPFGTIETVGGGGVRCALAGVH